MAVKTSSQIATDITTFLPNNTSELISAQDERDRFTDLNDSTINIIDAGLVVQALLGYSSVLTPSDNKHFTPKKYVDDLVAAVSFDWGAIGGTITDQTDLIAYFIKTAGTSTLTANAELDLDGFDFTISDGAEFLIHLEPDKICFFTDTPFTSTSFSFKSKDTGAGTFASIWQDVNGTEIYKFRDDGYFFCNSVGDLGAGYGLNFSAQTLRTSGGGLTLDYGNRTLNRNGDIETLDFQNKILEEDWSVNGNFTSDQFILSALNTAPSSASDTGTLGEIRIDASHIYICTATDTWKRVAIATF